MPESFVREVQFDEFPVGPGTELTPQPLWLPPKGVAYALWGDQLPPEYCAELSNWRPRNGRLEPRPALELIGQASSTAIVFATEFVPSSGVQYTIRWLIDRVQIWSGITWVDVTGVTLTGTLDDLITVTTYADLLIFSNGVLADGTWAVDAALGSGTKIVDAPAFKHITTFTGRLVGSHPPGQPTRIQWSVKNSHTNWTGVGSGYEDLLSTPGGRVDQQFGVHPVTDNIAFVMRSEAIWTMTETGDFDAPFTFGRRYPQIGSTSRFGVTDIPNGIAFVSRDGIYEITVGAEPNHIGLMVDDRILGEITDFDGCYMVQSPRRNEIIIMPAVNTAATKLYIYNRLQQSWTTSEYKFPSKSLSTGRVSSALTFDQLSGDFDSLAGTFDTLGLTTGRLGMMFAMGGTGRYVVVETFDDATNTDFVASGEGTYYVLEAQTGLVKSPDNLSHVGVPYLQLTYAAPEPIEVTIEYSDDDGTTWTTYMIETIPASARRTWMFRNNIERERLAFRIRAYASIAIYGFIPYVKAGRKIGL